MAQGYISPLGLEGEHSWENKYLSKRNTAQLNARDPQVKTSISNLLLKLDDIIRRHMGFLALAAFRYFVTVTAPWRPSPRGPYLRALSVYCQERFRVMLHYLILNVIIVLAHGNEQSLKDFAVQFGGRLLFIVFLEYFSDQCRSNNREIRRTFETRPRGGWPNQRVMKFGSLPTSPSMSMTNRLSISRTLVRACKFHGINYCTSRMNVRNRSSEPLLKIILVMFISCEERVPAEETFDHSRDMQQRFGA